MPKIGRLDGIKVARSQSPDHNDGSKTPRASIAGSCSMWTPASKRDQDVRCTLGYKTGTTKRAMWRLLVHRSLSYAVRTLAERWWLGQGRLGTVVGGAGRLRQQQPLRACLSLERLRQKYAVPSESSGQQLGRTLFHFHLKVDMEHEHWRGLRLGTSIEISGTFGRVRIQQTRPLIPAPRSQTLGC